MAVHESILHQRICRRSGCHAEFWICQHCDRGQHYCNPVCRRQARLQQRRCANRRYQQSAEARLDHCDRQKAYRCRKAHSSVTGHTSLARASPASCGYVNSNAAVGSHAAAAFGFLPFRLQPRCIRCGRTGRLVRAVPPLVRRP